jgi:hypothetical protein
MELADVRDSKSRGGNTVRVRPPPPAPNKDAHLSAATNVRPLLIYGQIQPKHAQIRQRMNGTSGGKFSPKDSYTREQAMLITVRLDKAIENLQG